MTLQFDWRQRFADYKAALITHERARAIVEQLQVRLADNATDEDRAALEAGLAIAERRARLAGGELLEATDAFTRGRSVLEAVWAAPDDI